MRVLVVLTQPPLPEGGAPGRCAVGLLRGLEAHGVEVRALAARRHFSIPGDPPADLPVEVVPVEPPPPGWATRLERLRRPLGDLAGGEFAARVHEAATDVDVVHLEETETAWCDEGVSTPSLVHVHYLARRDRSLGWPWQQRFRHVVELSRGERAAARRHRYLVASSPLVATALRSLAPHAEVVLAPLSVDPRYYRPAPLDGPPIAGIVGTAGWPPTAAAVRRLVERVWPHVRRRVPDATLKIAGRGMHSLGVPTTPGVEVIGEVPSANEFLRGLSLLLFPLERGSGVKVKVLESIATGLPVITTAAGAEGIDGGAGVVVHEDDVALAAAAAELLDDGQQRRERGAAGRAAFERLYTPEPATRPLLDLYARMAG